MKAASERLQGLGTATLSDNVTGGLSPPDAVASAGLGSLFVLATRCVRAVSLEASSARAWVQWLNMLAPLWPSLSTMTRLLPGHAWLRRQAPSSGPLRSSRPWT